MSAQHAELLAQLYASQIAQTPNNYLKYHSSRQAIASRVNSFLAYQDYLPTAGRLLEWGCQHAPDASLIKAARPKLEIIGCDLPPKDYAEFWSNSGLDFVPLTDPVKLPFEDASFNCVIGAGVLEHVPMDYESLRELHRVMKPRGTLIITQLPNRYSYIEFLARNIRKADFHRKLYTKSDIRWLLERSGFSPLKIQRYRILPSNTASRAVSSLSKWERLLERIWPLSLACTDLLAISEKVSEF